MALWRSRAAATLGRDASADLRNGFQFPFGHILYHFAKSGVSSGFANLTNHNSREPRGTATDTQKNCHN